MGHNLLEEFRDARRSSGLSRQALASRISIDDQIIKRLENAVGSVPVLVAAIAAIDFRLTGIGPGSTLADQLRGRRLRKATSITELAQKRDSHARPLLPLNGAAARSLGAC